MDNTGIDMKERSSFSHQQPVSHRQSLVEQLKTYINSGYVIHDDIICRVHLKCFQIMIDGLFEFAFAS